VTVFIQLPHASPPHDELVKLHESLTLRRVIGVKLVVVIVELLAIVEQLAIVR
jgi:hypothetical protein